MLCKYTHFHGTQYMRFPSGDGVTRRDCCRLRTLYKVQALNGDSKHHLLSSHNLDPRRWEIMRAERGSGLDCRSGRHSSRSTKDTGAEGEGLSVLHSQEAEAVTCILG